MRSRALLSRGLFGLTLACALSQGSVSQAATYTTPTYTMDLPIASLEWDKIMTLTKFDPALYTRPGYTAPVLTKATFLFGGNVVSDMTLENTDARPHIIKGTAQAEINLLFPAPCDPNTDANGCLLVAAFPKTQITLNASAYDGNIDFAGSSGTSVLGSSGSTSVQKILTAPADLASFQGTGNVVLPCNAVGSSISSGSSNLSFNVVSRAGATVSLVYEYQEDSISFGDPHQLSRDGYAFDFHFFGDFILAKNAEGFMVQSRQGPTLWHKDLTWNTAAAVGIGSHRINVVGDPLRVTVDGAPITLPSSGAMDLFKGSDKTTLVRSTDGMSDVLTLQKRTGERVIVRSFTGYPQLDIRVNMPGLSEGLLGNGDGDPSNDLALRDGTVLRMPQDYALIAQALAPNWLVKPEESLFDDARATGAWVANGPAWPAATGFQVPEKLITVDSLDSEERAAAEQHCASVGLTSPYLMSACTLDVALSGDPALAGHFRGVPDPIDALVVPSTVTVGDVEAHGLGACTFAMPSRQGSWGWLVFVAMAASRMLSARAKRND